VLWCKVSSFLSAFLFVLLMSSSVLLSDFPLRRCERSKQIASDDALEPDDCTQECADDFLSKRYE